MVDAFLYQLTGCGGGGGAKINWQQESLVLFIIHFMINNLDLCYLLRLGWFKEISCDNLTYSCAPKCLLELFEL